MGKPISQTGKLRLSSSSWALGSPYGSGSVQHAQGHMVNNSGAQIRRKTRKLGLLPLQVVASLPGYRAPVQGKLRNVQATALTQNKQP